MQPAARERARELIMRFGWNTTCYQLLNPGMRLWFAPAGDAVIGYVTHAGVRVVAGAPVTPHARFTAVAAEFEAEARAAGESVCFFAAEEWFEERWQAHSPRARVVLGAQPVWEPAHWSRGLTGNASLRAQLNRARNKGVRVVPVAPAEAERNGELQDVLAEWLAGRGLPPLHFLVESALLDGLGDRRVFLAESPAGLQGFLLASPVPARSGWLAELTVRRPTAPNGTAELLISTAVQQLAAEGAGYFTLGLSPLARLHGAEPNPLWLRLLLRWLRAHGRRFYHFRGLEFFKGKFAPEAWKPVYALLPGRTVSPLPLYAIAAAFAGGSPLGMIARALLGAAGTEVRRLGRRLIPRS